MKKNKKQIIDYDLKMPPRPKLLEEMDKEKGITRDTQLYDKLKKEEKKGSVVYEFGGDAFKNNGPTQIVSRFLNRELDSGPDGEARRVKYEGEGKPIENKLKKLSKEEEIQLRERLAEKFGITDKEALEVFKKKRSK